MEGVISDLNELDVPQKINDLNSGLMVVNMNGPLNQLTFRSDLTKEIKARSDADTVLQGQIDTRALYYSSDLAPLLSKTDAASTYATTTSLTTRQK